MADDVDDEKYEILMDAIEERVSERFPNGPVRFSAFDHDDDGLPVDNLDAIAIEGPCVLVAKHDPFFGAGTDYQSPPLHSPTWWVVLEHANQMVEVTGDEHHIFLEGVARQEHAIAGVPCYEFEMGS